MALIQCSECGKEISDKAKKCPNCGCPIGAIKDNENNEQKKTKKGIRYILFLIIGIALICFVTIGVSVFYKEENEVSINELKLNKWRLIKEDGNYDSYEGTVTSDEIDPFVAVIGYYEENDEAPQFVYMENGSGILQTVESSDKDPSITYNPIGYMEGHIMEMSDIKEIECKDYNYYDYTYSDMTGCDIDIEIETKSNMNGFLFVELKDDLTKIVNKNIAIEIIDGKGKYSYYLSDLPLKSRGVEIDVVPKFFCNSKKIKDTDYTVSKPFSVEKETNTVLEYMKYKGTEEFTFNEYKDGIIIYSEKLLDGGETENIGETNYKSVKLENGKCTISTLDSGSYEKRKMFAPTYEFNIVGYVAWKEFIKGDQ